MSILIEVKTWTQFKNIVLNIKSIPIQYKEEEEYYELYASDSMIWHIRLLKGTSDAIDFEANYKDNANIRLAALTKIVDENENNLIGEIQSSPTQYTLLGRLKDLWDKLHDLFINGLAKIKIWDGTNQANVTSDNKLKVETYQASGQSNTIIIKDGEGNNYLAKVDQTGRLLVSTQTVTPPDTTSVSIVQYNSMNGTVDYFYIIPNGETLVLTKLSASAQVDTSNGSVVELFYAPNGDTTGLEIIDAIFVSGNADQHDLAKSYTGNGTRAILLRRRRLSGGSKEILGRWEGYY